MLAKQAKTVEKVVNETIDSDNSTFNESQRLFKDPESSFDTSVRIRKTIISFSFELHT